MVTDALNCHKVVIIRLVKLANSIDCKWQFNYAAKYSYPFTRIIGHHACDDHACNHLYNIDNIRSTICYMSIYCL